MEPWGTLALTGYSCEDFSNTQSCLLLRKVEIRSNISNEIPSRLTFVKKNSSSSPRPIKSSSNFIRCNCQKICSWSRRPNTIMEIQKKSTFIWVINNPIIYKFFKDFSNHRKKTNRAVVFSKRPFPSIQQYREHRWNLPTMWKTRLLKTLIEEFS